MLWFPAALFLLLGALATLGNDDWTVGFVFAAAGVALGLEAYAIS